MQASLIDMPLSVRIICKTFDTNPSVISVIGNSGNVNAKLKIMAEYAFIKSFNRNGVYISNNQLGTALFYRTDIKITNLKELYYEIRLAFAIPFKNTLETLKRERLFKKIRPYKKYYYFWFLGVQKGGENAVFELRDLLFTKANKEKLPILLETSVDRNVKAYERYGFQVYNSWHNKKYDTTIWFMKREPQIEITD